MTSEIPPHAGNDRLAGRVYMVTGAAAGIGRAVSRAFAAAGGTVILLDRAVQRLKGLYDELKGAGAPEPAIMAMDLEGAEPEDYSRLAETVETELGRLDGLVQAAGRLGPLMPLDQYPPEEWRALMQLYLNAPFVLVQASLPLLRRAPDPSIALTVDPVGVRPKAYWGTYAVAQAGQEAFARILAEEAETGPVRVNTVEPGRVRTELQEAAYPAGHPEEWRDPAAIAEIFLDLAAPRNGPGPHGQRIRADEVLST